MGNERMYGIKRFVWVDLINEYRTWGLKKLREARKEYDKEVSDMAREFGELHFVTLGLYKAIGDLLDSIGEFEESTALGMRIRDEIETAEGMQHPYYIH
jgi:hypothetical protein